MARIKISKGVRITFNVTAKDDTGVVIDLTAKKFGFVVFKQPSEVLCRFASPTITGWKPLTVTDAVAGKFSITIDPENTANASSGNYDAEIVLINPSGGIDLISKNPGGKEFIELFESPTHALTTL